MTRVRSVSKIETEDLNCPITLQLFRDPVLAPDGHVYEREAITKWILEHGTSPLTRDPLDINGLKFDSHTKYLADQRRTSIVSYNARDGSITLPVSPITPTSRSQPLTAMRGTHRLRRYCRIVGLGICACVVPALVILGLVLGLKNSGSASTGKMEFSL